MNLHLKENMHRYILLLVAVSLLTPSAGLMTLVIPDDEPYASTMATIADLPHIGKRFVEDGTRNVLAFVVVASQGIPLGDFVAELSSNKNRSESLGYNTFSLIRAPPVS